VSCQALAGPILDLARGALLPASRAEVLEHVESCAACRERLRAERRLSEGLRDWAAADADREPAPALEARLRSALRARHRRAVRPRRTAPAWAWPIAAAAAGLALWSAFPKQAGRVAAPRVEEAAFRPLFSGDLEDVDGYQVVRVELSRSALAGLGFATGEDFGARAVSADVIVGQDGVARGIRLVR